MLLYTHFGFIFFDDDVLQSPASSQIIVAAPTAPYIPGSEHFVAWLPLPNNYIDDAFTFVAGVSEHASYPLANMRITPVTTVWRTTSLTSQAIFVDLGSSKSVDVIALVNHNLTESAVITVTAGTDTSYASYSATMTWREFLAFKVIATAVNYQYWRVQFTDASNPAGYFSIGYFMLGALTRPNVNFRYGWTTGTEFLNQELQSSYRIPLIAGMSRKQKVALQFGPITDVELVPITSLYETVKGAVYPLLLLPLRDGTEAYFCRIQTAHKLTKQFRNYIELLFSEDGYGRRQ